MTLKQAATSEDNKKAAEEKKAMGNRKVAERNYPEAIKLYSEAIALNGDNAVYYANRYVVTRMGRIKRLVVELFISRYS